MQIKDEISRIPGVGDVFLFGQRDYSMRIWVDPAKLAVRKMSVNDVVNAIREQNAQVAVGSIGQEPITNGQETQVTLNTLGRLTDVEEFENIVVKSSKNGRIVRLKDVARVELGAKNQDILTRMDGRETVFLAIFQMPDANALDVKEAVLKKMADLKQSFPAGVDYDVGFDTTPYTQESIHEVVKTLRDAIILVAVVVLLFLQNWRSAMIPLLAVPVAIIGTFAVMAMFGFSLNNLTLFGLVLAIGIVVDDAIVVVEAVEHHMESGLAPREATIAAMRQVSGPVIAVGLVLSAVFVPCAFISGITGQFFRQFALTIAVSTLISTFNSLSLSPALTAVLLRRRDKRTAAPIPRVVYCFIGAWLMWNYLEASLTQLLSAKLSGNTLMVTTIAILVVVGAVGGWIAGWPLNWFIRLFFRAFNAVFRFSTNAYVRVVSSLLRITVVALVVYCGLVLLTYREFRTTRKGFIPQQDMGYLMVNVQLPDSASTERTSQVMRQIEAIAARTPGIKHLTTVAGQSFVLNASGSNFGSCFVNLREYKDRRDPSLSSDAIADNLRRQFGAEISDAMIQVFPPPPVRGVGRSGGFAVMIEDRGDLGPQELQAQTENMVRKGGKQPGINTMFTVFRANVPQLHVDPDVGQCSLRGVRMQQFADTLSVYEGSLYVNDFNRFGRTWQVVVQAEPDFRATADSISRLETRNQRGAMVQLGTLADEHEVNGPLVLTRYNMYPAAPINGSALPGTSSGQVIDIIKRTADDELPQAMAYEFTDMSYLELLAGNTAMMIFALAVVMVFLVLAAQYESWSLPLAVILVVPMCLLSAIIGVRIADMDINIFTQIGFVVLVGLASKNAILIVEFAKVQRHEGKSRREATLEACKLRLRPIMMTSFAFILGVLPLLMSRGAGAEMRRTLGTAVFSGMIGVTLFGIVLTPIFFFTIDWLGGTRFFHSHWMRRISNLGLDVISLRPARWGVAYLAREIRTRGRTVQIMNGKNGVLHNGTPEKSESDTPHGS
jgi:multidrug efflux pump